MDMCFFACYSDGCKPDYVIVTQLLFIFGCKNKAHVFFFMVK
ncbi:hypothetical protein NSE_0515 [Neorickettsia sennetsu str. Miyayama]|uniref:Uncharacterized protein n=1 Tax=Ehrlichia sennetsu (strain ATCC VR-367 / Miyayama) TaxID=222891 RepID=Q2GDP7_EHRS3|nr:hypothetical protein NSE_0515 [Neorickettsia sennetsu str. Miyayama]